MIDLLLGRLPRRLARGLVTATALLACGLAAAGCRSAPVDEAAPSFARLPFHIAVLPIERIDIPIGEFPEDAEPTDMQLYINAAELEQAIADELARTAFSRVSLLGPDADPVALGRAERADLLLEFTLRYTEPIWRERLVSGFTNFLLFAVGGPFVTGQRDFRYHADAQLQASLYDLGAIDGERVRIGDARARVFLAEASFEGVELNYNERRKGSSGWWKALFVPSGILAKQSDALEQNLRERVPRSLAENLAFDVQRDRERLVDRGPASGFGLDPDSVRIDRDLDGQVTLRGEVSIPAGSRVNAMRQIRALVGESLVEGSFGSPTFQDGTQRIPFRVRAPRAGRYLSLELEAGTRDRVRRTYTFDLESDENS